MRSDNPLKVATHALPNSKIPSESLTEILQRKEDHLSICAADENVVENGSVYGFDALHFVHDALPEIDLNQIDTSVRFLGYTIAFPFFISCMTGGLSGKRAQINRQLAIAADAVKVPIGLGSMRLLLEQPQYVEQFCVRPVAPHIPIMANIGAVQLKKVDHGVLSRILEDLDINGVVLHLNVGQEFVQSGGDTDFTGVQRVIGEFVSHSKWPVIVKETGFGIRPVHAKALLDIGVAYVDVAGAGGTNWITVEVLRNEALSNEVLQAFSGWGIPTPVLLDAIRKIASPPYVSSDTTSSGVLGGKIIASGGIRNGVDLAKSIALGAYIGGMARPVIGVLQRKGTDGVIEYLQLVKKVVKGCMLLTGARTIFELRQKPLLRDIAFQHIVDALTTIESRIIIERT